MHEAWKIYLELASISDRIKATNQNSKVTNKTRIQNNLSDLFSSHIDRSLLKKKSYFYFKELISDEFSSSNLDSPETFATYLEKTFSKELSEHYPQFPQISSFHLNINSIVYSLSTSTFSILHQNISFLSSEKANRAHLYCYRVSKMIVQKIDELRLFIDDLVICKDQIHAKFGFCTFNLFDSLGDPHNNSRSVIQLQSDSNSRSFFYKPRSCDGEKLWETIKSSLSSPLIDEESTPRLIAKNGFFELEKKYLDFDHSQWNHLYYKLGFDIFTAHLTKHTDLWFDNLVCSKDGFVYIDHENILQPVVIPKQREINLNGSRRDSSNDIANSVLMTMALSHPMQMVSSDLFQDMGCLSYKSSYRWPHLLDDNEVWLYSNHLPSRQEADCLPYLYAEAIKNGYRHGSVQFKEHRESILNLLVQFSGQVRVIRRSTFSYYDILRDLNNQPKAISGLDRWNFLVDKVQLVTVQNSVELCWDENEALLSEVIQLDNGDIPYFYGNFFDRLLYDTCENRVGEFTIDIERHLNNFLNTDYINKQLTLISKSAHLHESITPEELKHKHNLNIKNRLTNQTGISLEPICLFDRIRSILQDFVDGQLHISSILHSFQSNCLFIGEPLHYGLTGIVSTLDSYLSLFLLYPQFFKASDKAILKESFKFLQMFYNMRKQNLPSSSNSWDSICYESDLDFLQPKYHYFLNHHDQIDKIQQYIGCFSELRDSYKPLRPTIEKAKLTVDVQHLQSLDIISSDKIKFLRFNILEGLFGLSNFMFLSHIQDASLRHLLLKNPSINPQSIQDISVEQLTETALLGFDAGWTGWVNCGIFLDLALIRKGMLVETKGT